MNEILEKIIKNNAVQLSIVFGGLAVTLINFYIAFRLAPLVEDIHRVANRVEAVEQVVHQREPLIERYFKTESKVDSMSQDISDIKTDVKTIDSKIDSYLFGASR